MVIREVDFSHLIYFEKIHFLLLFKIVISRYGYPYKLDFFLSEPQVQYSTGRTQTAEVIFCGRVAVIFHSLKVFLNSFFMSFVD